MSDNCTHRLSRHNQAIVDAERKSFWAGAPVWLLIFAIAWVLVVIGFVACVGVFVVALEFATVYGVSW